MAKETWSTHNAGRPWTSSIDGQLKQMFLFKGYTVATIAERMGRTLGSILSRLNHLGILKANITTVMVTGDETLQELGDGLEISGLLHAPDVNPIYLAGDFDVKPVHPVYITGDSAGFHYKPEQVFTEKTSNSESEKMSFVNRAINATFGGAFVKVGQGVLKTFTPVAVGQFVMYKGHEGLKAGEVTDVLPFCPEDVIERAIDFVVPNGDLKEYEALKQTEAASRKVVEASMLISANQKDRAEIADKLGAYTFALLTGSQSSSKPEACAKAVKRALDEVVADENAPETERTQAKQASAELQEMLGACALAEIFGAVFGSSGKNE